VRTHQFERVLAQLRAPADDEQIIVAVPSGEPLREHHRRNRLVPREQRRGRPDTAHAPWPSAAACGLYRAVAITRPPNSTIIKSSSIRAAIPDLTFDGEARKASDKPSDNGPG
jgi:hypothetical protein